VVVEVDGAAVGLIELADRLRPEAARAVAALRAGGAAELVVLTGDRPEAARNVAARLGISARGDLLPDAKAAAVAEFQAAGHTVVMVGDGVNDAAALATADVGVAMGAAGSELAWEAGDVALLREDLMRLPELAARSRHAMRVVRGNLWFTAGYNVLGLTLAALGVLPPFLAASLQVVPDVGIMANSGRLLRPVRPAPPLTRAVTPASAAERSPP
jgi:Cd2+/Zn2+-exporting ATPase/Cu+-exporting ATPase